MCNCGKNKNVKRHPLNKNTNTQNSIRKLSNALERVRGNGKKK